MSRFLIKLSHAYGSGLYCVVIEADNKSRDISKWKIGFFSFFCQNKCFIFIENNEGFQQFISESHPLVCHLNWPRIFWERKNILGAKKVRVEYFGMGKLPRHFEPPSSRNLETGKSVEGRERRLKADTFSEGKAFSPLLSLDHEVANPFCQPAKPPSSIPQFPVHFFFGAVHFFSKSPFPIFPYLWLSPGG
jgi:hypothetical protein